MKTNSNASKRINQAFSSQDLIEINKRNKERYRLSMLEQKASNNISSKKSTSHKLEIKYQLLPPIAKMILNILDSRNIKWSSNPFNQQWLADDCKCSLRWVRECIRRLKEAGFIATVLINRGKPYKTSDGYWSHPNIYIVTPFLRWAESSKLYNVIVALADKIQTQFLQLNSMINNYINKEDKCSFSKDSTRKTVMNVLKKIGIMTC